jgi:hypothetical protein
MHRPRDGDGPDIDLLVFSRAGHGKLDKGDANYLTSLI